jgi:alpha-tubulin suppressor-like RCC1 family protein
VQALRYEIYAASAGMNHSSFVTAGGTVYTCG